MDQVGAHRPVARMVGLLRGERGQRSEEARERARHGQPRTVRVGHERAGRAPQRGPHDAPHERLQHLVAPLLGPLHLRPRRNVGGQQRRVGHARVELPGDRARAEHVLAVREHQPGHGGAAEAQPLGQPVRDGDQLDAAIADALELQRALGGGARMRGGDGVERGLHRAPSIIRRPCSSSWMSATRRPISVPSRDPRSPATGASRPCATRRRTSSGPSCAACWRCASSASATSRRRSSPPPCPSCGRSGRRWRTATSATPCP